jgi:hypothetical protein
LFLDYFNKNCNTAEFENFEDNFSSVITSTITFSMFALSPSSVLPSVEELSGALESLSTGYDLDCNFFVKSTDSKHYNSEIDETTSDINEDIDWTLTAEKLIDEVMFPIIVNSLQKAFGDYDVVTGSPEDILRSQVGKACYEMAESIDDDVLSSMINPNDYVGSPHSVSSNPSNNLESTSIDLFNNVAGVMDPYYTYPNLDYLEHFKKCIYIASDSNNKPNFIAESTTAEAEDDSCFIGIIQGDGDYIEYNDTKLYKFTAKDYKKDIKKALTDNCIKTSNEKMPFFSQIARREYNQSLAKIREYNEAERVRAEEKVLVETPNDELEGVTDPISGKKTGTSVQTTQMAESYQNSLQDFLTPTGDVVLDALKLFISTLLEGYFEELKNGIFNLPDYLAFDDFENFGAAMKAQFDGEGADYFTDTDWGEAFEDLMGIPDSVVSVGQSCIMNSNCESGLCDYNAESDKVCMNCDEHYKCSDSKICNNYKCVDCDDDHSCPSGYTCSSDFECILSE